MFIVKLVTFKTNHTIICELEEHENHVIIKKPTQIIAQGQQLGFVTFLEYTDEFLTGITISRNDILVITTPLLELANKYNEVYGSGLTIAKTIPLH